jgi:hypothetical protein
VSPRGSETIAEQILLTAVLVDHKKTTEPQCKLVSFEYTEMESCKYEAMYEPRRGATKKTDRILRKLEDKVACSCEGNYTVRISVAVLPQFPPLF